MSKAKRIQVIVLPEHRYDAWNKMVAQSPDGSVYSMPEYLDALCAATGGRFHVLACMKGDEIVGGIGVYIEDSPVGRILSNRLLLYYNPIVLRKQTSTHPYKNTSFSLEALSTLQQAINEGGYARVRIHNRDTLTDLRPFVSNGWSAWPSYTYVAPIADMALMEKRIEQNLKRLVKRCQEHGVTCTEDEDMDSFFRMHLDTHHRKGAPLYLPEKSFRRYFMDLKRQNMATLFHARLPDGQAIATQMVLLGPHPVSHTVSAAADADHLNIGSTPFLRWSVFERLSQMGYVGNDLTDAALNPVTRFKGQLGGDLKVNLVLARPDSAAYRVNGHFKKMLRWPRRAAKYVLNPFRNKAAGRA